MYTPVRLKETKTKPEDKHWKQMFLSITVAKRYSFNLENWCRKSNAVQSANQKKKKLNTEANCTGSLEKLMSKLVWVKVKLLLKSV